MRLQELKNVSLHLVAVSKVVMVAAITLVVSACATKFEVKPINGAAPDVGKPVDVGGVPFREPRVHTVQLYAYDNIRKKYVRVSAQDKLISSPDAVYALAGKPEYLSNKTLKTKYRRDGTLSNVDLSSESQVLNTLNNVFGEVEKLQTISEAKDTAEAEALTATNAALIACVEAKVEVDKADATVSALPDTATELERVTAEGALEVAEAKQSVACGKAS